jgi:hypothetical protein
MLGRAGAGVVVATDSARHSSAGDRVLVFAASHCLDLSPLVTHHYGIDGAAQASATFGGRSAKFILDPAD